MNPKNKINSSQVMHRADQLMQAASNRYLITVQVAKRSKGYRYSDYEQFEYINDPMLKPPIRAILEMSDELTQPEIIG